MIGALPRLTPWLHQQPAITGLLSGLAQPHRQTFGDWHRLTCDLLLAAAFAARRHHEPRVYSVALHVGQFKPCKLTHAGASGRGCLHQETEFGADAVSRG